MLANRVWPARYELPRPVLSEDDARRIAHLDIAAMSDRELFAERSRVAAALSAEVARSSRNTIVVPDHRSFVLVVDWLEERLRHLDAEIARRRGPRR